MSDDKKELVESEHINLKVIGPRPISNEIYQFKMKKHAPMMKLMNAYCNREGWDINEVQFLFAGVIIHSLSTPSTLELEEGDTIDVFQCLFPRLNPEHFVTLKVLGLDYQYVQIKIKKHAPMRKLMNAYGHIVGLDINAVQFLFDGELIPPLSTPSTLQLKEGDTIKVYQCLFPLLKPEHITLKVLGLDHLPIQMKIKKHVPMMKLMNAYCSRYGVHIEEMRFLFDGKPIHELSTPSTLQLQEGSTILALKIQQG